MEVEYHNLYDYFTSKYPRDFECEALDDVPEFKRLLNKLYELFKGMKISDDDAGESDNNEINDPRKIYDPWSQFGPNPPYQFSILCIEMSELEGLKGFSNYDEGIFNFGFSKITPEIFINDIQKIMKYNPEFKSVGAIFRKYVEIKTPQYVINLIKSRDNQYDLFKKRINELMPAMKIKEEQKLNKKNREMEQKLNRITDWLEKNASIINFKIGSELKEILLS